MSDPLFLLSDGKGRTFDKLGAHLVRSSEEATRLATSVKRARWIVTRTGGGWLSLVASMKRSEQRLLLLEPADVVRRELLASRFAVVVAPGDGVKLLAVEELVEALASKNAADLFIGGMVDREAKALVLYRGNLDRLVVPLSVLRSEGRRARVDLDDFEIIDGGQTVRLGAFEAAADAILYELDPDARRRMKERAVDQDATFGGALRRLRLQRGLSRADFPGIHEKTIARIERGEVERPHGGTLDAIAKRLGVAPEEIETY